MASSVYLAGSTTGNGGTGAFNVSWPFHATNDIGILTVRTHGVTPPTPSGWTLITSHTENTSQPNYGSSPISIFVYWKRAASGSEAAVSFTADGTLWSGRIATFRGVILQGNPIKFSYAAGGTIQESNKNLVLGVSTSDLDRSGMIVANVAYIPTVLNNYVLRSQYGSSPTDNMSQAGWNGGTGNDYTSISFHDTPVEGGSKIVHQSGSTILPQNAAGAVVYLIAQYQPSAFTISAGATVSNSGNRLFPSAFTITAGATVSNPGNVNRESAFTITAGATVSNPGAKRVASAFAIAAGATVSNPGSALVRSAFVITGSSSMVMEGASDGTSSFTISSSSSMNMVGAALAESAFEIEGTSFVDFKAPQEIASAFTITSTSSMRMYSPTLTITTLQDGSGGDPDGGAQIDWTLCDFVNIELTAGTGSYPIDHINLIAGKKISVHVHNGTNANGALLWDGGDAPVNWGPYGAPTMPANGETLHLVFECNEDRTEILGTWFFKPPIVMGTRSDLEFEMSYRPNSVRDTHVSVCVKVENNGNGHGTIELRSDANDPPTTVRALFHVGTFNGHVASQLSCFVPAGHYWMLHTVDGGGSPTFFIESDAQEVGL